MASTENAAGVAVKRSLSDDEVDEVDEVSDKRRRMEEHRRRQADLARQCPYLDTIDRNVLDFDFEKLCSVSLSRINVYACLVCGKYFQGRGQNTHAYTHSVSEGHRVYLNLESKKFYCLPDNYEVVDPSLSDIIYVLNPTFTRSMIRQLETGSKEVRAHNGTLYAPGVVGLNNIKANDYCNVVLQALSHVAPIRNYFLDPANYASVRRRPGDHVSHQLLQRFGELIRKLWNPKAFKAHVSPHEMLQAVVLSSKKQFQITEQGDAVSFLSWLLNALHLALNGTKKAGSSVVYETFRGEMRIFTKKIPPAEDERRKKAEEELPDNCPLPASATAGSPDEYEWKEETSPFLYLTTELPPPPLFKDEHHENIIPQVSLYNILSKFNGTTEKEYKTYKDNFLKKFEVTRLPPYIILYIKRFTKNTFYVEKNPTIVNFPIKSIEFGELLSPEMREKYPDGGHYDLMANIVHEGTPKKGTYKLHVLHEGSGKWFVMQDLHIDKVLPEILPLSEAYIQIYKRVARGEEALAATTSAPPTAEANGKSGNGAS